MLKRKAVTWPSSLSRWWVLEWHLLVWFYCSFSCSARESRAMSGTHVMQENFPLQWKEWQNPTLDVIERSWHREMVNLSKCFTKSDQTRSKPSWLGPSRRAGPSVWSLDRAGSMLMIDKLVQDHGQARPCWALCVCSWEQWKPIYCFIKGQLPSLD